MAEVRVAPGERDGRAAVRSWLWVTGIAVLLGLLALLSNLTTTAQLEGRDPVGLAIRRPFSLLLNSGTVWAGLMILAGRLARRWSGLAGMAAGLLALLVHYGVAELAGAMEPGAMAENASWFVAAALFGFPLGLIGRWSRRPDLRGLAASLVVPAGALAEVWILRGYWVHPAAAWPDRWAAVIVSGTLTLAALTLGAAAVLGYRRAR